jgi:dsRNA-specific ribonuclease
MIQFSDFEKNTKIIFKDKNLLKQALDRKSVV